MSSPPLNTTSHARGRAWLARTVAASALLLPLLAAGAPVVPDKNISTISDLAFGRLIAAGGGAVTVAPSGSRTRTGAVVLLASSATPARFAVTSQNPTNDNKIYVLTLPPNGSVSLVSGANSMGVTNFISNFPAGSPLPPGNQTVRVGATLQVAPNQPPGTYSGSFNVTVEYQ